MKAQKLKAQKPKAQKSKTKPPPLQGVQSSNWAIDQLPGLSEQDQAKLRECGIGSTLQLLHQAGTPLKRQALAAQLQIHIQHVNKWVALANLARVPAVGCQHCGLLLHAGISSPAQLAQTPLPRLHHQILKLHVATLQSREFCPSLDEVAQWIKQARLLSLKATKV